MINIDEKVNRKIESMKSKSGKCPSSVNWFSLKNEITKDHLKLMISAFYDLPWVKKAYVEGSVADGDCEKYFFNHTMKFHHQGEDVSEVIREFPPMKKAQFIPYLLKEKEAHTDKIVDYLLEL